jgi:hypothetical protein
MNHKTTCIFRQRLSSEILESKRGHTQKNEGVNPEFICFRLMRRRNQVHPKELLAYDEINRILGGWKH